MYILTTLEFPRHNLDFQFVWELFWFILLLIKLKPDVIYLINKSWYEIFTTPDRPGVVIRLSFVGAKREEGQILNSRFFPSHWTDKFPELKIDKRIGESWRELAKKKVIYTYFSWIEKSVMRI